MIIKTSFLQDVGRALNIIKRDKGVDKKKKKHNAQPKTAGRLYMKFVDPPQTVGNNALLTIQIYQDIYYVVRQFLDSEMTYRSRITNFLAFEFEHTRLVV